MPMLIRHIDAIAREKQRAVLFVVFGKEGAGPNDWQTYSAERRALEAFLESAGIGYEPCGQMADECSMRSYAGWLYLDVPFDESDALYQRVAEYLENPDGTLKCPWVRFCYLPLEMAMKNAHHDEPGFWEHWAENF